MNTKSINLTEFYKSELMKNLSSLTIHDHTPALLEKYGSAYTKYRQLWEQADTQMKTALPFPIHLDLDILDACNLRCKHCLEQQRGWSGKRLDLNLLKKILDEGKQYHSFASLNLGYAAEPLIDEKLFTDTIKIISDYARPIDLFVHTNALNLTPELSEKIINSRITCLCVSLEGVTTEEFRNIRGGSLQKVRQNIISFCAMRKSYKSQLPAIRLSTIPGLNPEKIKEFVNFWAEHVDIIEFQDVVLVDQDVDTAVYKAKKMTCRDPWRRLAISPDGNVYPCCAFRIFSEKLLFGNITNDSLANIWHSEKILNLRERLWQEDYRQMPGCTRCRNSYYQLKTPDIAILER